MNDKEIKNHNDRAEWLQQGISKGWVSDSFCHTHEGYMHMSEEDWRDFEDGGDPCYVVIKVL